MHRAITVCVALLLAAGCASSRASLHNLPVAQLRAAHVTRTLDSLWLVTSTDTTTLAALTDFTGQFGESGARTLLRVVTDSAAAGTKRLHALWGLTFFWGRWSCEGPSWNPPTMLPGMSGCQYPYLRTRVTPMNMADSVVPLSAALRQSSVGATMRDSIRKIVTEFVQDSGSMGRAAEVWLQGYGRAESVGGYEKSQCGLFHAATTVAVQYMQSVALPASDLRRLGACNVTGVAALTLIWPMASSDSATLHNIVYATSALLDKDLGRTLLRVARDPEMPLERRRAAIAALGTFVHTAFTPLAGNLVARGSSMLNECSMPARSANWFAQINGSNSDIRELPLSIEGELRDMGRRLEPLELRTLSLAVANCGAQLRSTLSQDEPFAWLDVRSYRAPVITNVPTAEDLADVYCESLRGDLMQEADVGKARSAMQTVGKCQEAGGRLLAERWRTPLTKIELRDELQRVSGHFLDGRIFDALCEVIADQSGTLERRSWALAALYSYAQIGVYTPTRSVFPSNSLQITGGIHTHWSHGYGTHLVKQSKERVRDFIQLRIIAGDNDAEFLGLLKATLRIVR